MGELNRVIFQRRRGSKKFPFVVFVNGQAAALAKNEDLAELLAWSLVMRSSLREHTNASFITLLIWLLDELKRKERK